MISASNTEMHISPALFSSGCTYGSYNPYLVLNMVYEQSSVHIQYVRYKACFTRQQ